MAPWDAGNRRGQQIGLTGIVLFESSSPFCLLSLRIQVLFSLRNLALLFLNQICKLTENSSRITQTVPGRENHSQVQLDY